MRFITIEILNETSYVNIMPKIKNTITEKPKPKLKLGELSNEAKERGKKLILKEEEETKPPVKSRYTESQKKATYKYRAKNKAEYNKYQRERHQERLKTDPDYVITKKQDCANSNKNKKAKDAAEKTPPKQLRLTCGCGSNSLVKNKKQHELTNGHIRWVNEQIKIQTNNTTKLMEQLG